MTSLVGQSPISVPRSPVPAAEVARGAAESAGVEIRLLHDIESLTRVADLFLAIWKPGNKQPPVAGELMRAMAHSGCYVAGAIDPSSGDLLGACAGFFGSPASRSLHSHIAGVLPDHQGRSIGFALKTHQYDWAVGQGLERVTWTFDPLLRRNAYFNLTKLGALPVEYAVDFYGAMSDGVNHGQGSDRVLVAWPVLAAVDVTRHELHLDDAVVLLATDGDDRPVVFAGTGAPSLGSSVSYLVQTPCDIERIRRTDPDAARAWRLAVREVLVGLMDGGARVTGFTRDGHYVVEAR